MKLKKLLAAVTAAALAVSTMAVTSFTASAADENVTFASTSGVNAKSVVVDYSLSSDKQNDWEYMYSNVNVIVKTWNNSASAGDWLENGMGGSEQEQYFTAPKKWVATYEGTAINSNFTVNLTAYDVLDALEVLYAPSDNYNFVISSVKAYSNADGAGDIVWQYPASSEEKHDYKVELDKETATVKAEETVTIKATVKDGDKAVEDAVVTWSTSDEAVATVKDGVVTGVKAGEATIKASYKPEGADKALEKECTVTVTAKEDGGDEPPVDDKSVTGSETLTGSNWWAEKSLTVAELLGDLDKTKTTITFTSDDDIIVGYKSKTVVDESADDPNWKQNTPAKSVVISSSDIDFDNFMLKVCVSRNDDKEVTINWIAKEGSAPVEPEKPTEPTSKVLWEGSMETGEWANNITDIDVSKFANAKAGDKLVISLTAADGGQLAIKYQGDNWPGLPGFKAANNGNDYCDVTASIYEHTLTAEDVAALKDVAIALGGKNITITKVELITSGGGSSDPEPPKPDDPKPDDPKPDDPKPDNTITTPSDRVTYPVVIPFGYTPATDEDITNAVSSTAEGDTASVNLTSNTRVDKAVLDTIAGKDITVEFKLKGGAKWVINGKNVEKAKKVDLGVRLRSKAIPAEKVSTVAGENKTVQFSLRHNGDLGFTGALIIPFSSAYNGKFANLYYNNTAKDELEFVGSSKISAGQASFIFTHASDYVVVIDDEAYGEDVSSAAGVYEISEMTAAPYVAAVAVIAVLGAAAVVIKKRFAK